MASVGKFMVAAAQGLEACWVVVQQRAAQCPVVCVTVRLKQAVKQAGAGRTRLQRSSTKDVQARSVQWAPKSVGSGQRSFTP
jgi:hypothetical protein